MAGALRSLARRTVIIEGNIASGKTACLHGLGRRYPDSIQICDEPVTKWRNLNGHNTMDLMYKDPKRWGLMFQTYVQLTMLNAHLQPATNCRLKVMERSLFSSRYCFIENLYRRNLMEKVEYLVLCEWYRWLIDNVHIGVDLIVYLRTRPEVVHRRVLDRCRQEESPITLDYLKDLHNLHDELLVANNYHLTCPIITIDANVDAQSVLNECDRAINDITMNDTTQTRLANTR